jgi:hypothetical protein
LILLGGRVNERSEQGDGGNRASDADFRVHSSSSRYCRPPTALPKLSPPFLGKVRQQLLLSARAVRADLAIRVWSFGVKEKMRNTCKLRPGGRLSDQDCVFCRTAFSAEVSSMAYS